MNEFEDRLRDAFQSRRGELGSTHASTMDVRRRARRRTRRRAAVGAGAVAALGVVGAATVIAGGSGSDARQLTAGSGDGGDGTIDAAANGGLWRCTGLVADGYTRIPTSTVLMPTSEVDAAPYTTTTVLDAATTSTLAVASVTTTTRPVERAATSTSMATSTTAVVEQSASSTTAGFPTSDSSEYYFQHCEQVGLIDANEPDTVSPPNMEVEASVAPTTSTGPSFDANDAVSCLPRGADFFVLMPTCWKMAVDTGTTDVFMQSLKTYVESTLVGYRLTAVGDGDTIVSIAGKFSVTPEALVAANGGDPNMMLTLYQPLLVPPSA